MPVWHIICDRDTGADSGPGGLATAWGRAIALYRSHQGLFRAGADARPKARAHGQRT